VIVYGLDGEPISVIRGSGTGGGRIRAPHDIAFGPDENLYITDRQGIAVQVYDRSGRYLRGWGRRDIGVQDFSLPGGIAVDEQGSVYVADSLRQEVKVFSPEGELQERFGGFGQGAGAMAYPADVAAGPGGRVYVLERVGRRVQVFARIPLGNGPDHPTRRPGQRQQPVPAPQVPGGGP
jgi:DNA-binding beta-propeller fold protein YncE